MPDDLRESLCNSNRNKVHNKCDALELSPNHSLPPPVHGKIIFHVTIFWCQNSWRLLYDTKWYVKDLSFLEAKKMKIFINHSDRWIHQKRRLVYLLEVTRHSEQLHLACHKGNWPVEWMSKYWGIINIYMGFRESAGTQCHYFSFSLSHFPRILLFCNH